MRTTLLKVSIKHEPAITSAQDAAIREGLCLCFPADRAVFSRTRTWHHSAPTWTVLMESDCRIVAHCGIVDRTIRVHQEPLRVAGIMNVFVRPECRGSGLCREILDAAMAFAEGQGIQMGLLFCKERLIPLYQACGWRCLEGRRVTFVGESRREVDLPPGNWALYHPLHREEFPPGDVHLQGSDW